MKNIKKWKLLTEDEEDESEEQEEIEEIVDSQESTQQIKLTPISNQKNPTPFLEQNSEQQIQNLEEELENEPIQNSQQNNASNQSEYISNQPEYGDNYSTIVNRAFNPNINQNRNITLPRADPSLPQRQIINNDQNSQFDAWRNRMNMMNEQSQSDYYINDVQKKQDDNRLPFQRKNPF